MNYETPISETALSDDDEEAASAERRKRRIILAVVVGLGLLALFYMVSKHFGGSGGEEDESAQLPRITYIVPGEETVTRTINATGSLSARHDIPVAAVGEGGRVTAVLVDAGDWVKQGQVMATIDRSVQVQQIAGLDAAVTARQADLRLAQANLDRAEQLIERGFISKADLDRLRATRDAAAAQVRASQAQLQEARARTGRLNILAPKGGYVLERMVEPGATVTQGSGTLFRIAQNGEMELQARVGEAELARLSVGQSATVSPVGSGKTFEGRIWQISPTINASDRQGIARVAIGFDPALRPGGFASVLIESGTRTAPLLPESAILSDEDGLFVYIIGKDAKVVRRKVETGDVTEGGIVVTGGLSGSERIVLRAGGFLNPGEAVRPVKYSADVSQ